ncbi:MAG: hypothetical protein HY901_29560 [Deltaproteobacteria bacterium]|nr:hypothetical protein [Deltaproteobacteria bacterium]
MNNPIVKLAIVVVVVLGGSWFGLSSWKKKSADYEHRLDLDRIRKEYIERAPLARLIPEPDKLRFEQAALLKWYFNELNEHYNKFQGLKNYERFGDDLEARKRAKKIKEGEFAQYQERYQATHDLWELMRTNKYDPVFIGTDRGLRFDIYEVKTTPDPKEPKLRLAFALYGAQRKWSIDSTAGARIMKLNVNANFHELVVSGLDADGKEIRKMSASGDPNKIENPERFVEEFPPGVVFGFYEIPKIPAEVVTIEMTFEIGTRSVITGEEIPAKFVWKQALPAEWKLPAGAGWEGAQEQVREEVEPAKGKRK